MSAGVTARLSRRDGSFTAIDGCQSWGLEASFEYSPDAAPQLRAFTIRFSATSDAALQCQVLIEQQDICGAGYYDQDDGQGLTSLVTLDCGGVSGAYQGSYTSATGYLRLDTVYSGDALGGAAGEPLPTTLTGALHVQGDGLDLDGDFAIALEQLASGAGGVSACAGGRGCLHAGRRRGRLGGHQRTGGGWAGTDCNGAIDGALNLSGRTPAAPTRARPT